MYLTSRSITFLNLILLILTDITCLTLNLIILFNTVKLPTPGNEIFNIQEYLLLKTTISIIINLICLYMHFVYGLFSLYFKITSKLFIYSIL